MSPRRPIEQNSICAMCGNVPCAFPQIVATDDCNMGHVMRTTMLWGLCADHAQPIEKRPDVQFSLGPYELYKGKPLNGGPDIYESFRAQYPDCCIRTFEVRMVAFASEEGAKVMKFLRGVPQPPPPLHPVPIDMYSGDKRAFDAEFAKYGQPIYFGR